MKNQAATIDLVVKDIAVTAVLNIKGAEGGRKLV